MPARLHPGVYVEEAPSGARSIEGVSTSTAIFVGETERGPLEPTLIKNRTEFERLFGGYLRQGPPSDPPGATGTDVLELVYAIDAFFQNGGKSAYILRATEDTMETASRSAVRASSPGAWANDALSVIFAPSTDGDTKRFRLIVYHQPIGAPALRMVENWDRLSTDKADENYAPAVLKRSLYVTWAPGAPVVRPTTLDATNVNATEAELLTLAARTRLSGGVGGLTDVPAVQYAKLLRRLDGITDASLLVLPGKTGDHVNTGLAYVESRPLRDLFYIVDLPRQEASAEVTAAAQATRTFFQEKLTAKTDLAAVYWPWVEVSDPVGVGQDPTRFVAPSGHLAGLYARTDARRGVWKAPAGVEATLLGVRSLEFKVLDAHQDDLNPLGINALRLVPSAGVVAWGARTMRPGSEWRYVSVRRTAIFLRKSIFEGIQWVVFEPNDEPLWASLRLNVEAFMEQQFRQGAFAGRTSREAYFVKCDAETTTEADKAAGIVNLWVGFAPLRPAEFVVVKLSQKVNTPS